MPGAKYNDAYAKVRAIKSGPTQDQQLDVWFSPFLFLPSLPLPFYFEVLNIPCIYGMVWCGIAWWT
jgi:hypothetical protein